MPSFVSAQQASPRTWKHIASPRLSGHTATVLPDGQVLAAGGCDKRDETGECTAPSAKAYLFNPKTNRWKRTGDMTIPRVRHTATMLHSGKVLVVGYNTKVPSLRESEVPPSGNMMNPAMDRYGGSAELYDSTSGTWEETGRPKVSPIASFFRPTTTLLSAGKVLLVSVGSEVYDPLTGEWSPTQGRFLDVHVNHTATLLASGKVLVTADGSRNSARALAELYDPKTDSWSVTAEEPLPRAFQTSTLLPDGRLLVVGGLAFTEPAIASNRPQLEYPVIPATRAAEIYDPIAETPEEQRPQRACDEAASPGCIAKPGGWWKPTNGMRAARMLHSTVALKDGSVLVVGGTDGKELLRTSEFYHPPTGRWRMAGQLGRALGGVIFPPTAAVFSADRTFTASVLKDDTVLVAGGESPQAELLESPVGDSPRKQLPTRWLGVAALGACVLVLAGFAIRSVAGRHVG